MKGTITTVIPVRIEGDKKKGGFGFIKDEEGRDRFFHARDVQGTRFDQLSQDNAVEFEAVEVGNGKGNGLRAEKVRRA